MLLSWIFVSSHIAIFFLVKENKFSSFSNVYISVNTIFKCLYMFFGWEKGHQLSTYATIEGMGWSSKMQTAVYRESGCHALSVPTHLHYIFSCFWKHFCLIVCCFICINLTLPLFKENVLVTNGFLSLSRPISFVMNKLFPIIIVFYQS